MVLSLGEVEAVTAARQTDLQMRVWQRKNAAAEAQAQAAAEAQAAARATTRAAM
jgi:hypothetical protein